MSLLILLSNADTCTTPSDTSLAFTLLAFMMMVLFILTMCHISDVMRGVVKLLEKELPR